LLFCGITLKHYAYFNMSRRTQLTTKYIFQVLAQLSENFIFIYLGLALFTDNALQFQPPLIIVTVLAVCVARWVAVFPLSRLINWVIRYRAMRRGGADPGDELPYSYQAMLFWAGLRGAVGVALAALLTGENSFALRATVLVVVVLTVIIFGGTTSRMLEILGIRTGVVDEIDSDDEFDIESFGDRPFYKRSGTGVGFNPRRNGNVALGNIDTRNGNGSSSGPERGSYASGHHSPLPSARPSSLSRKNSARPDEVEGSDLLGRGGNATDSDIGSDIDTSDLPPPARRSPRRRSIQGDGDLGYLAQNPAAEPVNVPVTATAAFRQLFSAEDPTMLFRQLDEDFIKPKLLLDGGGGSGRGNGGGGGAS
jgi:solute carrier family 9 (sodium/hydrogen exchanger), member 6/7